MDNRDILVEKNKKILKYTDTDTEKYIYKIYTGMPPNFGHC